MTVQFLSTSMQFRDNFVDVRGLSYSNHVVKVFGGNY